jgi:hypothetical protein
MKVVVFGTNHDVQEKDYKGTNEFRSVLEYIIRVWQVELVMEEWTSTKGSTVGKRLASGLHVQPLNVGTPSTAEFKTDIPLFDPMEEPPMVISRHSPLAVQIKREEYMVTEIQKAMIGRSCGLFIVGLAHLHSMSEKLLKAGYEVEAFYWTTPPLILE